MTNYCITKSKRFKAAISGAGDALYITNYGHDIYEKDYEMELGTPWENRALWEKLSPFNSVQNVNAAVLIMGGEIDWNVPIINSEQLYQALKSLGRTTDDVLSRRISRVQGALAYQGPLRALSRLVQQVFEGDYQRGQRQHAQGAFNAHELAVK